MQPRSGVTRPATLWVRVAARLSLSLLTFVAVACADDGAPEAAQPQSAASSARLPELDREEVAALRSLGYVDTGSPLAPEVATGVQVYDERRAAQGLNLFTNARPCSTQLIDMEGAVLHSWSYEPCRNWSNAILLPNGDLVVAGRIPNSMNKGMRDDSRFLMRLTWDGEVMWKRPIAAHHDLDRNPAGQLHALIYAPRVPRPQYTGQVPAWNDSLLLLADDGSPIEEATIWEFFDSSPEVATLQPVRPKQTSDGEEVDLFHMNSIEWMRDPALAKANDLYALDHILVSLRNQDSVAILDWPTRKVVWTWGRGQLSGPHDATLLPSGNILIFDNGLGRDWSRVVEVDPRQEQIVWEYRAPNPEDFYSATRGGSQRLSNGNTLITESDDGVVFEVTADGDIVWRFQNPTLSKDREPSVIVRMRRLEGMDFEALSRAWDEG